MLVLLTISTSLVSCKEEWDDHYSAVPADKLDVNVWEYIESQEELSVFAQMLKSTGYDKLLTQSQTFTVWAPNNTALAGVNLNDADKVLKIVENHITRFSLTTSGLSTKVITSLNNKLHPFSKSALAAIFAGKSIVKSDIAVKNGIIHIINEYAPYKQNFWEYLNEEEGLDSLRTFINSLTTMVLDVDKSFVDGVLIDSIMKPSNVILDYLAAMDKEDSIYSIIMPDNNAWDEAYAKIYPYFRSLPKDGGEENQRAMTQGYIVNNLYFRGRQTMPLTVDTLVTTNGFSFTEPNQLFEGAQVSDLSNGLAYKTSNFNFKSNELWHRPIKVEAETSGYGRLAVNYAINTTASIGTGFDVSRGYFITAIPQTTSNISPVYIEFPIPNTLSGKYNIYCVFVPTIIVDTTDLRPNKVRFSLTYVNNAGNKVTQTVNANNQVQTSGTAAIFTTDPTQMTKMLAVKEFEFPYANVNWSKATDITVALRVANAAGATGAELTNFNRTLRIDCIILEPVQ